MADKGACAECGHVRNLHVEHRTRPLRVGCRHIQIQGDRLRACGCTAFKEPVGGEDE